MKRFSVTIYLCILITFVLFQANCKNVYKTNDQRLIELCCSLDSSYKSKEYTKMITKLFGNAILTRELQKEKLITNWEPSLRENKKWITTIVLDSIQSLLNVVPRSKWPTDVMAIINSNNRNNIKVFDSTKTILMNSNDHFCNSDDSGIVIQEDTGWPQYKSYLCIIWRNEKLYYKYSCPDTIEGRSNLNYSNVINFQDNNTNLADTAAFLINNYKTEYKFCTILDGGSRRTIGFWRKPNSTFTAISVSNADYNFNQFHQIELFLCRQCFSLTKADIGCPSPICISKDDGSNVLK